MTGAGDRDAKDSNTYRSYYDWVTGTGIRHPVDIGDQFTLCTGPETVTFTVVSAGTDGTAAGGVPVTEENDRGLCLHVEYGDFDLATCGDIDGTDEGSRTDVESQVAPVIGNVEVVKVNHHGSSYSSNTTYVTTLDAEAAVISVGKNSYGHPAAEVITRWDALGDVYQTQDPDDNTIIDGDVTVTSDGVERLHDLNRNRCNIRRTRSTNSWNGWVGGAARRTVGYLWVGGPGLVLASRVGSVEVPSG